MNPTVHFIVTCDGGSIDNHDKAVESRGYGSFIIEMQGRPGKLSTQRDFGAGVTNNEAEYMAFISALDHISDAFKSTGTDLKTVEITVNSDSQLMIRQLVGTNKVHAPNLIPLADQAKKLMDRFHRVSFNRISGDKMKEIIGH